MTTRLHDGIRQPKVRTDGTIRYPLSKAYTSVLSQPFEPTCFTHAVKHSEWQNAMVEEYNALVKNDTWTLVCLIVTNSWPLRRLDIKNAFLNGILRENVFMTQPHGFVDPH